MMLLFEYLMMNSDNGFLPLPHLLSPFSYPLIRPNVSESRRGIETCSKANGREQSSNGRSWQDGCGGGRRRGWGSMLQNCFASLA